MAEQQTVPVVTYPNARYFRWVRIDSEHGALVECRPTRPTQSLQARRVVRQPLPAHWRDGR